MVKSTLWKIWIFITVSLWVISLVMFTVAGEMIAFNSTIVSIAAVLTIAFGVIKRKELAEFIKRPYVFKVVSSSIRIFLVLCILAIVNYLAVKTSKSFDLTASKLHTLSEQSKDIAKQIKGDTLITLFAKRADWEKYLSLLRQYKNENAKISIKAVDVETNPALARLNNIEENGTLLIENGAKKVKGSAATELEITNLLIKTLREKQLNVYYTVGHGELDRHSDDNSGGSFLFSKLNNGSYNLKPLDTLKVNSIPKDADVVLVLGPKKSFMDLEAKILKKYLRSGGNMFIILGPNFQKINFSNLKDLMKSRAILHHNALVLDRLSAVQGANATIPIVNTYNREHIVTKKFSGRTLFPLSAAIEGSSKKNFKYAPLAFSSPFPASWAESQLQDINSGKVYYNKGVDLKGPVALMAVSESTKDFGKMAVGASIEMLGNAYQNQSSNFNLFMNVLSWLMDDEGIISLNRPELSNNLIILSASQMSLIFYFSILFLPFVFFGLAIWIYRRRAKK